MSSTVSSSERRTPTSSFGSHATPPPSAASADGERTISPGSAACSVAASSSTSAPASPSQLLALRVADEKAPRRPNRDRDLQPDRRFVVLAAADPVLHPQGCGDRPPAVVAVEPARHRVAAEREHRAAVIVHRRDQAAEEDVEPPRELLRPVVLAEATGERLGQRGEAREVSLDRGAVDLRPADARPAASACRRSIGTYERRAPAIGSSIAQASHRRRVESKRCCYPPASRAFRSATFALIFSTTSGHSRSSSGTRSRTASARQPRSTPSPSRYGARPRRSPSRRRSRQARASRAAGRRARPRRPQESRRAGRRIAASASPWPRRRLRRS